MKLNFNKGQGFSLPEKLYQLLNEDLAKVTPPRYSFNSITFNLKDDSYSPSKGGYHPVEIRLEKQSAFVQEGSWAFVYITDFSYAGLLYPELIKEIDICFKNNRAYSLYGGWLNEIESNELYMLFIDNFIDYYESGVYSTSVSFD